MSIEVMRNALEALENNVSPFDSEGARSILRQAIEQAEKVEPVAWMMVNSEHDLHKSLHFEPMTNWHITWNAVPLYTHPAPAHQPLTLNQVDTIENKVYMATTNKGKPKYEYALALVRAVEQAHGIKGASL